MSWRELGQVFADGDVIAPVDLNDTFIPMLSEINGGIDRDNIGYEQVTDAKIAVNQVNLVWGGASDGPDTYSTQYGRYLPLTEILSVTITAEERIAIKGSFSFRRGTSGFSQAARVYAALMVDDTVVEIEEPMRCEQGGSTKSVGVAVDVSPGTQTVRLMFGAESLTRGNIGIEIIIDGRSLTIVEGRR